MRYCIYGAGYRGRRLLAHIGASRVSAFIDADAAKQGTVCDDVPVISLCDYEAGHADDWIIVSPSTDAEIVELLRSRGIVSYSSLAELPSEFAGYGFCPLSVGYRGLLRRYDTSCVLYGIHAFSLMLYDALLRAGNAVSLFPRRQDVEKAAFLEQRGYLVRCDVTADDHVFLCTDIGAEERGRIPAAHVTDALGFADDAPFYFREKTLGLKDTHRGERCFIVGTGPSLRVDDLRTLARHGVFTFSMNDIVRLADVWQADAYVVTDSFFMTKRMNEVLRYPAPLKILGDSIREVDALADKHPEIYPIHIVADHGGGALPAFSEHVEQKVIAGGTVTYACMQLAAYMGFTEIFLLGIDGRYQRGGTQNHFFSGVADQMEHRTDRMMLAYQAARQYADAHGIKIYNATRGGYVETFERVEFDAMF